MEKNSKDNSIPYTIFYNKALQRNELKVFSKSMYPLFIHDEEGGLYKIQKNRTGKLQMVK